MNGKLEVNVRYVLDGSYIEEHIEDMLNSSYAGRLPNEEVIEQMRDQVVSLIMRASSEVQVVFVPNPSSINVVFNGKPVTAKDSKGDVKETRKPPTDSKARIVYTDNGGVHKANYLPDLGKWFYVTDSNDVKELQVDVINYYPYME